MTAIPEFSINGGKPLYKPTRGPLVTGWPIQVGPRVQLASKKCRWSAISRPRFHGLIAALAGLERQSPPGAIQNHYRRRRQAAAQFYARVFGSVPVILREHHLKSGPSFYRAAEYKKWSASAYQQARPQVGVERPHNRRIPNIATAVGRSLSSARFDIGSSTISAAFSTARQTAHSQTPRI